MSVTNNMPLIRQQLNIDVIGELKNGINKVNNFINRIKNIENSIHDSFEKGEYAIGCVKLTAFASVSSVITIGILLGAILYAEGGSIGMGDRCFEICYPKYGSMFCRCLFGS